VLRLVTNLSPASFSSILSFVSVLPINNI
jgi:hypothetical protein